MTTVPWQLKGCPECGGDCFDEGDGFTCLMCGWQEDRLPAKMAARIAEFRASNRRRRRQHSDED